MTTNRANGRLLPYRLLHRAMQISGINSPVTFLSSSIASTFIGLGTTTLSWDFTYEAA